MIHIKFHLLLDKQAALHGIVICPYKGLLCALIRDCYGIICALRGVLKVGRFGKGVVEKGGEIGERLSVVIFL